MSTGTLVRIYSVVGQLRPDGAIELIALDLERTRSASAVPGPVEWAEGLLTERSASIMQACQTF